MRYFKLLPIVLLFSWMAAGCGDNLGDYMQAPAINEPFYLEYGEEARVVPFDLFLTFAEVEEDSRCPTGVDCLWGGQVTVKVTGVLNGNATDVRLGLGAGNGTAGAPEVAAVWGHTVRLLEVAPYPDNSMDLPIPLNQYRIRLVVLD